MAWRLLLGAAVVWCTACDIPPLRVEAGTGGGAVAATNDASASVAISASTGVGAQGGGGAAVSYPELVIADGAVAYWRLGEARGATMTMDEIGDFDGTFSDAPELGHPALIAGDTDTSAHFVTCAHQVRMGDVLSFEGRLPFSLEAWIKPEELDTSSDTLMGKEVTDAMGIQGYRFRVSATGVGLIRFLDGIGTTAEGAVPLQATSYVVATYDGDQACVYVNAAAPNCTPSTLSINITTNTQFGLGLEGACYHGFMDEVAVYSHPLTYAEIQAHYAAGTAR